VPYGRSPHNYSSATKLLPCHTEPNQGSERLFNWPRPQQEGSRASLQLEPMTSYGHAPLCHTLPWNGFTFPSGLQMVWRFQNLLKTKGKQRPRGLSKVSLSQWQVQVPRQDLPLVQAIPGQIHPGLCSHHPKPLPPPGPLPSGTLSAEWAAGSPTRLATSGRQLALCSWQDNHSPSAHASQVKFHRAAEFLGRAA
jgi:hypothetical protein